MKCAKCEKKACYAGKDCTEAEIGEAVKSAYKEDAEALKGLQVSTRIEARYYMKKTRVEELILYAEEMGYGKLGVAFCIGLQEEAAALCQILARHFAVSSVCCKVCGIDKTYFGLERLHEAEAGETKAKAEVEVEAMCNPIGQARVLNDEKTDLNIILGLCIGHDILFTKHSDAPVTTFAVKDRVLAHNPLGALYSGYYRKRI
ncbi:MAG: DUF1847 domain-containing protein [Candidatus Methanospirareceae archaeon]|nr:DUF1847 domain-containing protein [Methanophagales archaeon]PXF51338.1 MAG: hypothetical protein C4B55_02795 [Methanophagales archaeon]RLF93306.1 MAG: hypothetical protein DRN50_07445 [Thermococci archaeon]HDN68717.1 DUF1847 domain-containing protein [Methanomicrobia archaeon]